MTLSEGILRTARKRLLQMHFDSGVGHIGGNLSCLDAMMLIHHDYLGASDRFILSKGHSAGALYITLWSLGHITDDMLNQFHKDNTLLAGHPPASGIKGIPFATGSLGHGLSLAAGTALALQLKALQPTSGLHQQITDQEPLIRFAEHLLPKYGEKGKKEESYLEGQVGNVYCLTSDGEWQEGSTWEALIFATHHRLCNLTILVDHNNLQGFGNTQDIASMSPLLTKISGFDLDIQSVDGHDLAAIRSALDKPQDKCRLVILETTKGNGVSFMEDRMEWHYLPLKEEQYHQAIQELSQS